MQSKFTPWSKPERIHQAGAGFHEEELQEEEEEEEESFYIHVPSSIGLIAWNINTCLMCSKG